MVNHKWNILNALRFYNRIGKPFTGETYLTFYTNGTKPFSQDKVLTEIRRHIGVKRVERLGKRLVLTQKGFEDLVKWEQDKSLAVIEKRRQDYLAKGMAGPFTRKQMEQTTAEQELNDIEL